jgi:hypothetical protein
MRPGKPASCVTKTTIPLWPVLSEHIARHALEGVAGTVPFTVQTFFQDVISICSPLNRAPRGLTFGFVEDVSIAGVHCLQHNVLQRVWSFSTSLRTQSKMHAFRHVFYYTSVMNFTCRPMQSVTGGTDQTSGGCSLC